MKLFPLIKKRRKNASYSSALEKPTHFLIPPVKKGEGDTATGVPAGPPLGTGRNRNPCPTTCHERREKRRREGGRWPAGRGRGGGSRPDRKDALGGKRKGNRSEGRPRTFSCQRFKRKGKRRGEGAGIILLIAGSRRLGKQSPRRALGKRRGKKKNNNGIRQLCRGAEERGKKNQPPSYALCLTRHQKGKKEGERRNGHQPSSPKENQKLFDITALFAEKRGGVSLPDQENEK